MLENTNKISKNIDPLQKTIELIKSKDFIVYFFVINTKGNALASIEYVYRQCKIMKEAGYNAKLMYEPDKQGNPPDVSGWLGEEFNDLPHVSISTKDLNLKTADVIIIPELFTPLMYSLRGVPCHKIILCQNHENIFEFLGDEDSKAIQNKFNTTWTDTFKITDAIVTGE